MSSLQTKWRSMVIRQCPDLTSTQILVACGLADAFNGETKISRPGADLLASRLNLSTRSVERALKGLKDAGLVELVSQGGTLGGPRASEWKLILRPPTPDSVSGVTPDSVSGVPDATPDTVSTTPDTVSTTPDTESDQVVEVVEVVLLPRAEMVRIGKRLVRNFYNKVPGVIAELVADLGAEAVSAALRDLDATGERFPGQIGLEAAIRDRATPAPTRPFALYQRPECDTCNGSGMTYDEDANAARPCPECNTPQAVAG